MTLKSILRVRRILCGPKPIHPSLSSSCLLRWKMRREETHTHSRNSKSVILENGEGKYQHQRDGPQDETGEDVLKAIYSVTLTRERETVTMLNSHRCHPTTLSVSSKLTLMSATAARFLLAPFEFNIQWWKQLPTIDERPDSNLIKPLHSDGDNLMPAAFRSQWNSTRRLIPSARGNQMTWLWLTSAAACRVVRAGVESKSIFWTYRFHLVIRFYSPLSCIDTIQKRCKNRLV